MDARDAEIERLTKRVESAADGLLERDGVLEMILLRELRLKELLGAARDDIADIVSRIDAALAGKEGKP